MEEEELPVEVDDDYEDPYIDDCEYLKDLGYEPEALVNEIDY